MEARILHGTPTSGSLPEIQFYRSGAPLWVEFTNEFCESWIGCFSSGETGRAKVLVPSIGSACFVLAAGRGYWVESNERRVLHEVQRDYLEDAVLVPDAALVVISDFTTLELSSPSGRVWRSKRISLDGIEFTGMSREQINGTVYDGSRVRPGFAFYVEERILKCEWECPF